ncbi:MAG: hypothetical protein ABSF83_00610 [Nitrososphaerales archaeon]|jgi:hypothetical protein
MPANRSIRLLASGYRRSARLAVFVILLASFFAPAMASTPGSLNLSPDVSVKAVSPFGCGEPLFPSHGSYQASGGAALSGSYSGPVFFRGSVTIEGHDKGTNDPETETLTLTQGDFGPDPLTFPGQAHSSVTGGPQVSSGFCQPEVDGYTYWVAAYSQAGCSSVSCLLANSSVTVSVSGGSNQMFQLLMELPLFNETTLGTTVHCAPTTSPCGLPLQGFYDLVLVIALVLAGAGFLIALTNKQFGGNERQNVALDTILAILFIILFPIIYNNVALLTDYLDMTILSGPGHPFTFYGTQISLVWAKLMSLAQGGGIWGALVSPITTLAAFVVALVVYTMTLFLGIIRIWLVTVMVIAFPISLALKLIPFTKKLSSMVEDTLYGLVLASLMSSIAIGVAAYVLADAPGGPVWSATIFAGTNVNGISNWVAAAALFTAVLIPTVFAPLTGTIFQTASQAAMVGVGVGASMAGAAAAPMAAGAAGGGGAGMGGLGSMMGSRAGMAPAAAAGAGSESVGQAAARSMDSMDLGERLLYAAPHAIKNVAIAGSAGLLGAVGADHGARAIARIAPVSTHRDVARGIGRINASRRSQRGRADGASSSTQPDPEPT